MTDRVRNRRSAAARPAIPTRAGVLLLCTVLLLATARLLPAQTFTAHVRAGPVLSTPLAEDAIAAPGVMTRLFGEDFAAEHPVAAVRARSGIGAGVVVGAAYRVVDGWLLEADVGWTFGELSADDGRSSHTVQELGIGHALVALRRELGRGYNVRAGLGGIRYFADRRGLFRDGAELEPLLEAAAGAALPLGRLRLGIDLVGQAHSFGTPAFRAAGGRDGTVYRLAVQVSAAYGTGGR